MLWVGTEWHFTQASWKLQLVVGGFITSIFVFTGIFSAVITMVEYTEINELTSQDWEQKFFLL